MSSDPNPGRTKRLQTRILCRGSSRDYPDEAPIIVLRVQVVLCKDLGAKDRNGSSDPSRLRSFVTVSYLGKRFQTPVFKRIHDELNDMTFHFPIYTSLVLKPGMLKLVVWGKDVIRNKYLGECSLPIDPWSKETGFAFGDPSNKVPHSLLSKIKAGTLPPPQQLSVALVSSRSNTTAHGSIYFKAGFVHPPNSPNSGKTLIDLVRAFPLSDIGHIGIVVLQIFDAKDLPEWPNVTRTGWDVDPFVRVSTGNKVVGTTRVIQHSRNPVWYEQLDFPVGESDDSILLTVFDRDKFTPDDYIGEAEIKVTELSGPPKNDFKAGLYPDDLPTMRKFELSLVSVKKKQGQEYKTPKITVRASYQPYGTLWNHVCNMDLMRKISSGEPTPTPKIPSTTLSTEMIDPSSRTQTPHSAPPRAITI
ncbi:hypothetical protein EDB89DRAFT_2155167 [Lactarius sanguifluus]|nr:hypothetical protein EDB89DRAFT_2155167 [Lactarius sanguifluus]